MSSSDHPAASTDFVEGLTQNKCDPKLGAEVEAHLVGLKLEAVSKPGYRYRPELAHSLFKNGVYVGMANLGLDMSDPSMQDTPRRFADMFVGELTKGLNYDFFPKATTTPNDMGYDQMVLVARIQTTSLCEHHLQTIDGFTHIAYIPKESVLGLSKFARITEFFARRPQIQERMTEQVHAALAFILQTDDIAVVQKCTHFCMKARGCNQQQSLTTTDKMGGRFLSNPTLRMEFLNGIR